ncbi:protein angel [Wyeomyia smithii]|uniref:protein angel n=1 Tax=Wyeomyia smithii TaxID=174621 RepID=UPI002467ED85|nr:protein angel [Wyeomyia smithii]XP_055535599.1 protein angel [Wyeomyia smithii]
MKRIVGIWDTFILTHPPAFWFRKHQTFRRMFGDRQRPGSVSEVTDQLIDLYTRQKLMSGSCRKWQMIPSSGRRDGDIPFTLMSYNILAQDLLEMHPYLYNQHDSVALAWAHRYDRLITEINTINPDILCLQELQDTHKEQFSRGLTNFKYDVIYKKRTGCKTDGCAIYYRRDMFNLIDSQGVEFYRPDVKRLDRENVAIIAKFELKSNPSQHLVVATTHLLYNPRRQDIRLAQIQVMLAELDRFSYKGKYSNGTPSYTPTIVCGDFNLEPYTAPYMLLTTGFLQYENLAGNTLEPGGSGAPLGKILLPSTLGITDDCRHQSLLKRGNNESNVSIRLQHANEVSPSNEPKVKCTATDKCFNQGTLKHRFRFCSAYQHRIGTKKQEASTFQGTWITVDYLFYTKFYKTSEVDSVKSNLKLAAVYSLPTVPQARGISSIPNMYFGSDHFALAAKFLLRPDETAKL